MKKVVIAGLLAAFGAALFLSAADTSFPIYFPNSKLLVKADVMNRTVYLPVKEIVQQMGVPYTDAIALETLTMRSGSNRLVVTKNSALISYNDQIILLPNPILREDNRWLAPAEFLTMGLTRLTGTEFRYRPGTSRIFAGNIEAPELEMNAQTLGPITRVTLRCAVPITLEVKREDPTKAVLTIDHTPLDPTRERVDHRDRLLHSVAFDDSDGQSKIVLDMVREVADLRVTSAENNRVYFIDLSRTPEPLTAAPPAAEPPAAAATKPDAVQAERKVRVVVIDPGHGGMDTGAKTAAFAEKDLTLTLARKLRAALQSRLGATVLLTRDSDASMNNEARSAVANNNQANLFISLHVGYSPNEADSGSSVFVMKEDFGESSAPASSARDRLFLPWYLGYRMHRPGSTAAASILEEELNKGIPAWKFTVRTAPLAVLSSATMPSLILEVGNLNNPTSAQTLVDSGFQTRLVNSIVDGVQKFSESPQAAN
ncbi:MAG TPA: N-acetylmuramoyl-L-alanine amidase [Terriglobia bacterium]|jgi:N-acetylmuramoyl-L-alanine amidase